MLSRNNRLGEVSIRRGICQGEPLPSFLFVVALIPVIKIVRILEQGYLFGKGKERLKRLLFMGDLW